MTSSSRGRSPLTDGANAPDRPRTASAVGYEPDGTHVLVASADGAGTRWADDGIGAPAVLATIGEPITFMRLLRSAGAVAVGGASGALWIPSFSCAAGRFIRGPVRHPGRPAPAGAGCGRVAEHAHGEDPGRRRR